LGTATSGGGLRLYFSLQLLYMANLDHIGIAVANLPELKKLFSILGFSINHEENVPDQGVKTHFLPLSLQTSSGHLELLEVTDPEGTVAKFIAKRGPGIHHLSFSIKKGELDPLCETLKKAGYRLVYDQPKLGAHQMRINFIHPSTAGGILMEVMEPAK